MLTNGIIMAISRRETSRHLVQALGKIVYVTLDTINGVATFLSGETSSATTKDSLHLQVTKLHITTSQAQTTYLVTITTSDYHPN